MRTQSIEVGHVKATRKESIRNASVCPDKASKVQRNTLELDNGQAEVILRRLELMKYEVRGIRVRVATLEAVTV